MENPYAASELTPELVAEERRQPKLWRSLVIAYAVHHALFWVGFLSGLLVVPSEWQGVFPLNEPRLVMAKLLYLPIWGDLRTLVEPLFLDIVPPVFRAFRIVRFVIVLTLPVAGIMYLRSRRTVCLCYLGAASFVVGLALFVAVAVDWKAP